MKHNVKLFILLAAVLSMVACNKDKEEVRHERDIVYTVTDGTQAENGTQAALPAEETTTVHLETEAEWQALLDSFCDWAEAGSTVTFYNGTQAASLRKPSPSRAGSPRTMPQAGSLRTKDATTFSTTRREEMKRWMARMEDEGMTVTLTYDSETGTWHGTAYTTSPQPQGSCYTGVLKIVNADYNLYDHNLETEQHYWGLRINEDTVFRLSRGVNYIYWVWAYQTTHTITLNGQEYNSGDSVTLCGSAYARYNEWYDEIIYILDLSNSPRTDNLWRPYAVYSDENEGLLIITVDDDNHKLYCTSTYNDMTWQGSLGGGIFSYEETGMEDNLGNQIIMVYNDATHAAGKRFSIARHSGGAITIRDLDGANMPNNGQLWLNCSYVSGFDTWACDTLGFNIVIHRDLMPLIKYPSHGYSSSPFYVNCTTPFEAGKFYTDYTYSFSPLNYEVSGRTVNFNVEESDDNKTVTLTPIGEPAGCLDSYVFHRIEKNR